MTFYYYGDPLNNLYGYLGSNHLIAYGFNGDDTIAGNNGNDYIDGGSGNDSIYGGSGIDTLIGSVGNDRIDGGPSNDFLYGGIGRDILYGSQGNDYIDGESDEDFLDGGSGNDFLLGGLGNDFIDGGLNNDYLDGGDSNDTLTGGIGQDILLGGTGRDSFVFNQLGMSNRDIIKDFDVLSDTIILGNSLDNDLTRSINPGIKGLVFRGGNFSNNQLDSSKFFKGSGFTGAAVKNLSGIYVDTSSGDIWYKDSSLAGSHLIANVGLFAAVAMTSADFIYGG
jgi:Ca2+-binding RTX toxin-like protein